MEIKVYNTHLDINVIFSGKTSRPKLDTNGKKHVARTFRNKETIYISGIADVYWGDQGYRNESLSFAKNYNRFTRTGNRLQDIYKYKTMMEAGKFPALYLTITYNNRKFRIIDGVRRTIAALEFGLHELPIVVITTQKQYRTLLSDVIYSIYHCRR